MDEAYYGLRTRPFAASPDPDCFAAVGSAEGALASLLLCAQTNRGIAILTSAAGLGKTLVCRRLARELADEWTVAFLTQAGYQSRRSLLQSVLFELGRPYARMGEQELRLELHAAAKAVRPARRGVLLVIDEAHLLGEKLLEEVRTIAHMTDAGQPLIQIVLSGQLPLEETLTHPGLEPLRQRIGCQSTLEPLTQAESAEYLDRRARWAGRPISELFTDDALRLICHASDGVPRCLNQLSEHGLLLGCLDETKPVTVGLVQRALDDLQQLTLHWNAPSRVSVEASFSREEPVARFARHTSDSHGEFEALEIGDSAECGGANRMGRPSIRPEAVPVSTSTSSGEEFASIEVGGECEPPSPPRDIEVRSEGLSPHDEPPVDAVRKSRRERRSAPHNGQFAEELLHDPWPTDISSRDLFEAAPGDETSRFVGPVAVTAAAGEKDNPSPPKNGEKPLRGASTESIENPRREPPRPNGLGDEAFSETDVTPIFPERPRGRRDHVHNARPHFAPPAPPAPNARRPRRASETPRGVVQEEAVFDRYAALDAGFDVPDSAELRPGTAETASGIGSDRQDVTVDVPGLRPDDRIDRIFPLLEQALSDDWTEHVPAAELNVHRVAACDPDCDEASVDLEQQIGESVIDSCREAQRALGRDSHFDESALDAPCETPRAVASAACDEVGEPEQRSSLRTTRDWPDDGSNGSPPRQYSQLFSALRKRFRRPA